MTRRNLSDILRQEVQKETSGADSEETKPHSAGGDKKPAAASRARKQPAEDLVAEHKPAEDRATAQIAELKAALAQGADHEKDLQAQVKALQSDVTHQKKEVNRFKAELAEAKELILKLSEENTQLNTALEESKTSKAQPKWKGALAVKPLPSHSVQHSESSTSTAAKQSKSVDVGWMD